jgi:hypothetical protein
MYSDNALNEETTSLSFQNLQNWEGLQNLIASMPDDLSLEECELKAQMDRR